MPESTQKPDRLSDEALEALERAARAASPGDWWYKHFRRDDEIQLYEQGGSVVAKAYGDIDDQDIANFELITALKNAAPLLIAAARENAKGKSAPPTPAADLCGMVRQIVSDRTIDARDMAALVAHAIKGAAESLPTASRWTFLGDLGHALTEAADETHRDFCEMED